MVSGMNEIYIYGDIVGEKTALEEVTALEVAEQLKLIEGAVTVRINSSGGDVFSAIAIYNLLKQREVEVVIDGICASAATIIMCAAGKIKMSSNALLMIHLPVSLLVGGYNETELASVQAQLTSIKNILLEMYKARTGKSAEELEEMLKAESWLTAIQAKEQGFVDEIVGQRVLNWKAGGKMDDKNLMAKFVSRLQAKLRQPADDGRLKAIMALKNGNRYVDAIVDVAVLENVDASVVAKMADAVSKVEEKPKYEVAAEYFAQILKDNLTSGAEEIGGSYEQPEPSKAELLVKFAR